MKQQERKTALSLNYHFSNVTWYGRLSKTILFKPFQSKELINMYITAQYINSLSSNLSIMCVIRHVLPVISIVSAGRVIKQ